MTEWHKFPDNLSEELLKTKFQSVDSDTFEDLRDCIRKNIKLLDDIYDAPEVYGSERGLVLENMGFRLQHLFICLHMYFCINGPVINDMSHVNYESVDYCQQLLNKFEKKYNKIMDRQHLPD